MNDLIVDSETQCEIILSAMKQGAKVSSIWGFRNNIVRLASRIHDLKDRGHNIKDEWHKSPNGKRFKLYYL